MAFPEGGGRDEGVSLGKREQVFVAGDEVVGLRCPQGAQNRQIGPVTQGCTGFGGGSDDVRQEYEVVGKIAVAYSECHPRNQAS